MKEKFDTHIGECKERRNIADTPISMSLSQ
jgi:hypothetical protein